MVWVARPAQAQSRTTATYDVAGADEGLMAGSFNSSSMGETVTTANVTALSDTSVLVDTCPLGAWAAPDTGVCILCAAGKYSTTALASSEAACLSCETGTWSRTEGASSNTTCQACPASTYSTTVGATSVGACLACPGNSSSFNGSKLLTDCVCNPGYAGQNGGPCRACNRAEWCLNGQANPCPANSKSGGLASRLDQCLCDPGYHGDSRLCSFCKMDYFCPGGGVNLTTVCPDGKYSMPGSDDVTDCKCPDFATSKQTSVSVTQCVCQAGYYKEYKPEAQLGGWICQACKPGEFCYDNANKTCPPHSTSLGVARGVLDCYCLAGFRNATVQTETELCADCPANSYCTGKGAVQTCVANAVSPPQSPSADKCFCDLGWKGRNNSACVACQSPTFCYGGIEAQCSEGTFSQPRSWTALNCSCIAGWWGPVGGPCRVCSAGKYNLLPGCTACDAQVDTDCKKCEPGTASNVLGRNTTCDVCPAGQYSSEDGVRCLPCQNGTFAATNRSGQCTACPLGWWAAAGSSACTACPRDTFLNVGGKGGPEACQPCPPGTVSPNLGNSDPQCSACPPGTFQQNGVCSTCPAGYYSRAGAVECQVCLAGTFSLGNGTSCTTCNKGSFSAGNASTTCAVCTAGFFAELAGMSACLRCPFGSISATNGSDSCSSCPLGRFAASGDSAVGPKKRNFGTFFRFLGDFGDFWPIFDRFWRFRQCGLCPAGSWSNVRIASADNCTDCGVGMYATMLGATRGEVCTPCLGGTFSTERRGGAVSARSGGFWEEFLGFQAASEALQGAFGVGM